MTLRDNISVGSISLRDYFASHAPVEFTAADLPRRKRREVVINRTTQWRTEEMVDEPMIEYRTRWAYFWADAMMKAREA